MATLAVRLAPINWIIPSRYWTSTADVGENRPYIFGLLNMKGGCPKLELHHQITEKKWDIKHRTILNPDEITFFHHVWWLYVKIQLKSPMSSHEKRMILLIHPGEDAASGAPVPPHVQRVFLPPLGPKAMEDAEVEERFHWEFLHQKWDVTINNKD